MHNAFRDAYRQRWNDHPRLGSVVGYDTVMAIATMLKKTAALETEPMVEAMKGLQFAVRLRPVEFRAIDHQSTMGAFVGRTVLKNGKGAMVDWHYADGAKYLPSDEVVRTLRPQA